MPGVRKERSVAGQVQQEPGEKGARGAAWSRGRGQARGGAVVQERRESRHAASPWLRRATSNRIVTSHES